MTALSTATAGAYYEIKWNVCTGESAASTASFGLCTGEVIYLTTSCKGNVIIKINGKSVALGEEVAEKIKV